MKLLRSTAVVSALTMVSRVLGFVRDVVLARVFGVSGATDAFFVAFRIPNLLRRLFAEGSFALAFVPVLNEIKASGDRERLKGMVDAIAGTLLGALLVITAIGVLAAPGVVTLFAPGFVDDAAQFEMASGLLRITFPYILFISLAGFCGAILNSFGRFAVPALTPVLLNLSLIAAALWLAPRLAVPVYALAWGVLIAGAAQLSAQLMALARMGMVPRPRWGWRTPEVKKVIKLMIPTLLGSSAAQINILIDTIIATVIAVGSVSWLYYSDRLLEFPLGVFGIALATVILPSLSSQHASGDAKAFSHTLDWALRTAMLIAIPACAGLIIVAGPIVTTLFGYGEFSAADIEMTTISVAAYALGLPAFVAIKVIAPSFFARQDAVTPVRISLIAMGANVVMNLGFVATMVHLDYPAPHAGLALSSSLAAYLNAGLLYRAMRRSNSYTPGAGWGVYVLRVAFALAMMVTALYFVPSDWIGVDLSAVDRATHLAGVLVMAGLAWFGGLLLVGWRFSELARSESAIS